MRQFLLRPPAGGSREAHVTAEALQRVHTAIVWSENQLGQNQPGKIRERCWFLPGAIICSQLL